jgi:hypothetical protein
VKRGRRRRERGLAESDRSVRFDDIRARRRIDGIEAMRDYLVSLAEGVPVHQYEMVDPKVRTNVV